MLRCELCIKVSTEPQVRFRRMLMYTCKLDCDGPTNGLIGTCDDADEAIQLAICPVGREVV
jgi:hypothetical protein